MGAHQAKQVVFPFAMESKKTVLAVTEQIQKTALTTESPLSLPSEFSSDLGEREKMKKVPQEADGGSFFSMMAGMRKKGELILALE